MDQQTVPVDLAERFIASAKHVMEAKADEMVAHAEVRSAFQKLLKSLSDRRAEFVTTYPYPIPLNRYISAHQAVSVRLHQDGSWHFTVEERGWRTDPFTLKRDDVVMDTAGNLGDLSSLWGGERQFISIVVQDLEAVIKRNEEDATNHKRAAASSRKITERIRSGKTTS